MNSHSNESARTVLLEDTYLPAASFITASSPLIGEQYAGHYHKPVTVIHNVFSLRYRAKAIKNPGSPLKLFWFSQTIGKGRGLEDIILALKEMREADCSLTLLGSHDESIKKYFMGLGANGDHQVVIEFLQPVSTEKIFEIAAQHDIGLALEQPGEMNRDLCLTNKIFTYLLAGNAIIFSETKAQRQFYEQYNTVGFIYESGNIEPLKKIITDSIQFPDLLKVRKQEALQLGQQLFNWEFESAKLTKIVQPNSWI